MWKSVKSIYILPQHHTVIEKEPVKEIEIQYASDNDIEASNLPVAASINELGERLEKNMEFFSRVKDIKRKKMNGLAGNSTDPMK